MYIPRNIKYKIVKLVLLWSFYRKNYFRKNFISFSQKEKRAYSLHQGKGGTLVYGLNSPVVTISADICTKMAAVKLFL